MSSFNHSCFGQFILHYKNGEMIHSPLQNGCLNVILLSSDCVPDSHMVGIWLGDIGMFVNNDSCAKYS